MFQAYGISKLQTGSGLHGWQWLFLIEGTATVCLALVAYKFLADYPSTVRCKLHLLTQ